MSANGDWDAQRAFLLGHRISDLGLAIAGTRVERLVIELYRELDARGLRFHPPVYLSDQWGCPDGTPLIGIPFYLADERLERIEAEMSLAVEDDREAMRYLRHEAGHAFNYAFRLFERDDWRATFGPFTTPYRERFRADPLSRDHVRHLLGWYAQKHPDEDFAETFAVWLTPTADWRTEYAGWPAMHKLLYVDTVMRQLADVDIVPPVPTDDDLPVESMRYALAEHYASDREVIPIRDERQFDADLRQIFASATEGDCSGSGAEFLRRHYREIVARVSFWTSEPPSVIRSLIDALVRRSEALRLRATGLEAATLIEVTAFATAVVMLYRTTRVMGRARREPRARTA